MNIKELKEAIKNLPDDSVFYAYEGEKFGINIISEVGDNILFINASEQDDDILDAYERGKLR